MFSLLGQVLSKLLLPPSKPAISAKCPPAEPPNNTNVDEVIKKASENDAGI